MFKQAFDIIRRKEHLNQDGLNKIVAIKGSINNGLSPELKAAFPDVKSVKIPLVKNNEIKDPNWLAGFISAEGCFFIDTQKSKNKIGTQVKLKFAMTQHFRDEVLLKSFIDYFGCGKYYCQSQGIGAFWVTKLLEIEKIIVFFKTISNIRD